MDEFVVTAVASGDMAGEKSRGLDATDEALMAVIGVLARAGKGIFSEGDAEVWT